MAYSRPLQLLVEIWDLVPAAGGEIFQREKTLGIFGKTKTANDVTLDTSHIRYIVEKELRCEVFPQAKCVG